MPLVTWKTTVPAEWVDYNGHLRDAYYLLIFSHATDALMAELGIDPGAERSLFTLECHVNYLHEVSQDARVEVHTQLLAHDAKRLHIHHSLHPEDGEALLAASEQMLLHVDMRGPKATPFAGDVSLRVEQLARAHADLPRPLHVGRIIGLPAPK